MNATPRLGLVLKKVLEGMSPEDHAPFLAYLEQKARYTGETDILAAVLDYRRMVAGRPHLKVVGR